MGTEEWISQNWFDIVVAACSLGGLWFSAFTIRQNTQAQKEETKARKSSNLLAITANHRAVWKEFFGKPELARVIEPSADVGKLPITPAEEFFVNMVISHTSSVYEALKDDLLIKQENLRGDVKSFFSLPVPNAVWGKTKLLQNQDFAAFIDDSLKEPEPSVIIPPSARRVRGLSARRTRSIKPRPVSNDSTVASTSNTG